MFHMMIEFSEMMEGESRNYYKETFKNFVSEETYKQYISGKTKNGNQRDSTNVTSDGRHSGLTF